MNASVVRKLNTDHADLRGKSSVLRSLALSVLRGDHELASALRLKGEELQSHMLLHMQWEEAELLPELDRLESIGQEAVKKILAEHEEQRARLAHSLVALRNGEQDPDGMARQLIELVRWLDQDMASEDQAVRLLLAAVGDDRVRSGEQRHQIE